MPIVLALVLVTALVATLTRSDPRLTGTNSVPQRKQKIGLTSGQEACQGNQIAPKGSGRLRMFVSPGDFGGTPRASMRILHVKDGVIGHSQGRYVPPSAEPPLPGTEGQNLGRMDFPIDPPVRHTRTDAYVCVRNTGRLPIVISGVLTPYGNVSIGRKNIQIALSAQWFAPKDETWLQDLSAIVPRVGRARMGGIWTFWVASVLLLAALALGVAVVIRETSE